MQMSSDEISTLVIDTCSVIYLSLYAEACSGANLDFGSPPTDVVDKIKLNGGLAKENLEYQRIKQGFGLLGYLKDRSDWEIYFSQISRSEMNRTLSERKFDELLTKAGVPFRIRRNKFARMRIDFDYEAEVVRKYENLKKNLEDFDIELNVPEQQKEIFENIYPYIGTISSTISLDVFDSYIYALAISVSAKELYSNDEEFRTTVNFVHTPNNDEWKSVAQNLKEKVLKLHPYNELQPNELPENIFPIGKPTD